MTEKAGALCGGGREVERRMDGAVGWCYRCQEYRAAYWAMLEGFGGYILSGAYRCDRCDHAITDFYGQPRFNLEES